MAEQDGTKQCYMLINPNAGMLHGCIEPAEVKAKLPGLRYDPRIFTASDDAGIKAYAEAIRADRPEVALIAGGDGTIATVLKALTDVPVKFGLIPTGSMNNIGQSIGLSDDLDEAVEVINQGHTERMDIARVNGKVFIESLGIGLLANIMAKVGEQDSKKEVMRVAMHTLGEVVSSDPIPVSVWADDRELAFDTPWLTVTNTGRAAAALVDPASNVMDRQIELVYCDPIDKRELPRYAMAFLRNSHLREKKFHHLRAKLLHLTVPEGTEVHVDGELMQASRLEIEVIPGAIEVFVP